MWLKTEKRFETGIERHWREQEETKIDHLSDYFADEAMQERRKTSVQAYSGPRSEFYAAEFIMPPLKAKKVPKNRKNGHSK